MVEIIGNDNIRRQVPNDVNARLKDIEPNIYAEWNTPRKQWFIKYKYSTKPTMIIYRVPKGQDIDGRVFLDLKEMMYHNRNDMKRLFSRLFNEDERRQAKIEAEEENLAYEYAKEMRRPMQMMARETGVVSGKAKIPTVQGWSQ